MYLLGDINLNILNDHRRTIANKYLSMLAGNGLFPLITKPTRITQESATLIDHIFTSAIANPIFPGIILSDISDDFFTYCAIPSKQPTGPEKQSKLLSRNIKNLDVEKYLLDLDKEMNDFKLNCPSISKENYEVIFAKLVKSFKFVIHKHAPLMQVSRKQRRLQSKPWLTKGLLVSIKRKQQLYRSNFLSVDLAKRQFYKTYSKKLQRLKSKAKRNFFFNEFGQKFPEPWQNMVNYKFVTTR